MFGDVSRITEAEGWDMHREGMQGATVVAGFPCTPWSKSGSQTGKVHDEGMVFWGLLDLMDEIGSEAFVFENVTNLLGEAHSEVWGRCSRRSWTGATTSGTTRYPPETWASPEQEPRVHSRQESRW